jgi:hypothetical protein
MRARFGFEGGDGRAFYTVTYATAFRPVPRQLSAGAGAAGQGRDTCGGRRAALADTRTWLHLRGVNYEADVFCNGREVPSHGLRQAAKGP